MTGSRLVRFSIAGLLLVAVAFVLLDKREQTVPILQMPSIEEPKDDAQGRAEYENLRLRDPGTGEIPAGIRTKELSFASGVPTREERVALARQSLAKGESAALVSWSRRGPANIGGRTRALRIDASNSNVVLAGGVSGGMWRSTNGGSTWAKTSVAAQLHSVTCLDQDTRAGKTATWYYGTGEYRGNSASASGGSYAGDGIYKSTDGGLSWAALPSTVSGTPQSFDNPFDYVWNVATDPSSAQDEVYAATSMSIRRSSDGGSSWTSVLGGFGNAYPRYTDVAVTAGGVVYAALSARAVGGATGATGMGIYRSTDGVSWTNITPASFPTVYDRVVLGVAPSDPNIVYFLATGTNGTNGVDQINGTQFWKYRYVSGDGSGTGGSWSNRGVNLPNQSGLSGNAVFDTQGSYNMLVMVKPNDTSFVVVGASNLYRSTDGFATNVNWSRIGGYQSPSTYAWWNNQHPDQHSGAFLPGNPSTFLAGHDGGISKTTDISAVSVAWTSLNNDYNTTQYYTVALDRATNGSNLVVGGMQDNGTWATPSTSFSTPWVQLFSGDGAACAVAPGASSYYLSSQNGVVYRFLLDDSFGLTDYARVDPTGGTGYLFINPFILDPNNAARMYLAGGPSLWRNSDLTGIPTYLSSPGTANSTTSVNWTNLTAAGVGSGQITALAVSVATPTDRLYYGTSDGRLFRLDNASSATTSTAPVDVGTGKGFPAGAFVSSIAVHPTNGSQALLVFSNYSVVSVFATTDAGASWTAVSGNLEQNVNGTGNGPSCRTASIVYAGSTTTYFVGASTGLYSTGALAGSSTVWASEGAAVIGNVVVDQIAARQSDGVVVIGTHGAGVFSGVVSATGVEEDGVPVETALLPNYPNPFNPSTTIRFRLARGEEISLRIYDLSGRVVVTLAEGQFRPGEHEVTWRPENEASGTYIARLMSAGLSQSRKVLFVK